MSFRLPGLENLRRLARRVADQKIAGQRAGFRLFIRADLRRREEDAGRLASKPLRFGLADERDEVMHDLALGGAYFRRLNPAVFSEVRRDDDVLIVDDPARRDLEGHRQLEDHVRLCRSPSLRPIASGFGRSRGSPSGDPPSAHFTIVSISDARRPMALENLP